MCTSTTLSNFLNALSSFFPGSASSFSSAAATHPAIVPSELVPAAAVRAECDQSATGQLGRDECLVIVAGSGAGVYGVCLHPVFPFTDQHWPGQIHDRNLYDPAIWRAVGLAVSGRTAVDGAPVRWPADRRGAVVGA